MAKPKRRAAGSSRLRDDAERGKTTDRGKATKATDPAKAAKAAKRRSATSEARPAKRANPPVKGRREAARALAADPTTIGLVYSSDADPGITRVRSGKGFTYRDPDGDRVTDPATLERIAAIVIPPAWTDVWISTEPDGHIQATGRDDRGRKQYRYHPRWREDREEAKFGRMADFARALPTVRERVEADLHRKGLPREKVLAAVVALLEQTKIRVGNDEYARANKSYGLTTLQDKHVTVTGTAVRFKFRGKSGKEQRVTLQNKRLATIVRRCRDLPGRRLFVYRDADGTRRKVGSAEVNAYLRELTGADYTAKDVRTWSGTVIAAGVLRHLPKPETKKAANRDILAAVDAVAERLGNTRAVARRSYVHPAVYAAYESGDLQAIDPAAATDVEPGGLDDDERVTLAALTAHHRSAAESPPPPPTAPA